VRASLFECAMLEGGQVGEQEFGFLEVCTQSGWAGDGNDRETHGGISCVLFQSST
ncbi:hypothetical protein GOODEAATRI_007555, partial [Goodea atripinnis]